MKLKLTPEGHAVVQDGKPVYLDDQGKEIAFDAPGTIATISRLNGEAKGHRERAEAAEAKSKLYEGLDPAEAKKALDAQKNWDEKQKAAAGERDKAIAEAVKAVEEKYAPIIQKASDFEAALYDEKIGGAFARSPLIVGEKAKLAIPADLVQARFGKHFKMEDGKAVAYDAAGNKVYSRTNPGNPADFDEALDILVDQYPHKASILKSSGASGGGAQGGGNGGSGGKSWTRAQFDSASQSDRMAFSKAGGVVHD